MDFLAAILAALQTVSLCGSGVKKHFCSPAASISQPGEFMTTWWRSISPGIYKTLAILSSLLFSVCREISQAPCDLKPSEL